jgi:hypothetical protein
MGHIHQDSKSEQEGILMEQSNNFSTSVDDSTDAHETQYVSRKSMFKEAVQFTKTSLNGLIWKNPMDSIDEDDSTDVHETQYVSRKDIFKKAVQFTKTSLNGLIKTSLNGLIWKNPMDSIDEDDSTDSYETKDHSESLDAPSKNQETQPNDTPKITWPTRANQFVKGYWKKIDDYTRSYKIVQFSKNYLNPLSWENPMNSLLDLRSEEDKEADKSDTSSQENNPRKKNVSEEGRVRKIVQFTQGYWKKIRDYTRSYKKDPSREHKAEIERIKLEMEINQAKAQKIRSETELYQAKAQHKAQQIKAEMEINQARAQQIKANEARDLAQVEQIKTENATTEAKKPVPVDREVDPDVVSQLKTTRDHLDDLKKNINALQDDETKQHAEKVRKKLKALLEQNKTPEPLIREYTKMTNELLTSDPRSEKHETLLNKYQKLAKQAQTSHSPGMQALGIAMILLAAVVITIGALTIPINPVSGGIMTAGGVALLTTAGFGLFRHTRPRPDDTRVLMTNLAQCFEQRSIAAPSTNIP